MIQVIIEYPTMLPSSLSNQTATSICTQITVACNLSVVNSVYMETEALQSIQ